jgi:hypothetical protein
MSYTYNLSTHVYSPGYKESLLRRSAAAGIAEASYGQKLDSKPGDSDLYIRTFLIKPGVVNKRGWSISRDTAWQNVYSAVGQPLVLYESEHGLDTHDFYGCFIKC